MAEQKLLYIINHMDWFWSHRLKLAQTSRDSGWTVQVGAFGAGHDQKLEAQNFQGLELPQKNPLLILCGIYHLLRTEKPNLVHAITLKYAFLTALAALLARQPRAVYTIAGLGYLFSREDFKSRLLRFLVGPWLRLALKSRGAAVIFQNPDDRALLINHGFVRAEQTYLVRGSGVDLQQFPHMPEPESSVPVVLMPTRLVRDKGIAVFIDAAKLLTKRGVHAKFQIAGGISHSNPLAISENEMSEMLAGSAVEWLGKVDDMPRLYARAHLIAYPSYYGEGVPKVLLEAAATGRAIITTDHPGCREVVRHKDNGLLVPVKNADALADAIQALLDNPGLRKLMGERSRERAENEFDAVLIAQQTLAVYQHIVKISRV